MGFCECDEGGGKHPDRAGLPELSAAEEPFNQVQRLIPAPLQILHRI